MILDRSYSKVLFLNNRSFQRFDSSITLHYSVLLYFNPCSTGSIKLDHDLVQSKKIFWSKALLMPIDVLCM